MKKLLLALLLLLIGFAPLASDAKHVPLSPAPVPAVDPLLVRNVLNDARCKQWVDSVMRTLSLEERVGQLFIYTIAPQTTKANKELLRKVVEEYKVGGLLFTGGQMQNQVALTNAAQQMANVPLMITFDGEWGLAMRLRGTPSFPRNMVLGCIQNDSLLYEYGREMARQCRELGIQVNFAPVADVNINPQNPVINTRSFGESPHNVTGKVLAYSRGLEDGGVLSVSKHFPGHGDTEVDSHKALPVLNFTRERLDSIELYPFRKYIQAGMGGVMVGHLDVSAFDAQGGLPSSLSRNVVYDLLTREFNFRGLIFTDALTMKGVGTSGTICLQALQAGNDLLLVPRRMKEEVEAVMDAVKRGEFSEDIVDEKCRKVLTYKYALGLKKKPYVRLSGLGARINTAHTRDLIRRLKLAAITVLDNRTQLLPLDPDVKQVALLNVGSLQEMEPFVQELSKYTQPVSFQLLPRLDSQAAQALRDTLDSYKRILVCVAQNKLATYQDFFATFAPKAPVVYLCFIPGKQILQIHRGVSQAGAVVLAHSTNEDVQRQVAKLLYAHTEADGRLSASIGGLFAAGTGVKLASQTEPHFLPEDHGMSHTLLAKIDEIAQEGIDKSAYPSCQIAIMKGGREVYNKAFGAATPTSIYDIASLTKTTATLLAVMKLHDQGKLNLSDRVGDVLPLFRDTDKRDLTVKQLLLHESGLPATILFYEDAIDKKSYTGSLFKGKADKAHTARIGAQTWANTKFSFRKGLTSKVFTAEHTLKVSDSLWLSAVYKQECLRKIAAAPLREKLYRYSCVGFILLQQLVEARAGMPMDEFLAREFYTAMGLKRTGFLPLRFAKKQEIVPSSTDLFLRKSALQGFVHDESAAFLGGVSGNAGLFSTASEVARVYQMLLNGGELNGQRYLSAETCRLFTTTTSKTSRRGLGFDKPDVGNLQSSPCAAQTPASVYGHTGFTGTCAWADPENQLVVVFLSNRTYPHVWNTKLQQLDIRKRVQQAMYQSVVK